MARVHDYLDESAITALRNAIAEAGGREVFFIGHTDADGRVTSVEVVARGNAVSVAALTQLARYGDVAIHNHPSGPLEPSDADIAVSSLAALSGVASFIINNDVTELYVVVEPMKPPVVQPLNIEELVKLIGAKGPLARVLPQYEARKAQVDMLREVATAFNHDAIAVIEAGTGTGKTLAYLIPAVAWALQNGERVVISTHTINLQEQILRKDLPVVRHAFDQEFKAVLVKGRNNYICLRRVHALEDEPELFQDEDSAELRALIDWAYVTQTGDMAELNFYPRLRVWERVNSTPDTCTNARCPFFRECFVFKARRDAATAHILVTNHSLLCADLAVRAQNGALAETSVLPRYGRVIFDEAHTLEEVATDHFGASISRRSCLRLINQLYRRGRAGDAGSLPMLTSHFTRCATKLGDDEKIAAIVRGLEHLAVVQLAALQFAVNDCFEGLAKLLTSAHADEEGTIQYRLTPERRGSELWQAAEGHLRTLTHATTMFVAAASSLLKEISDLPLEDDKLLGALTEVSAQVEQLKTYADVAHAICTDTSEEFVTWLEARVEDTYLHVSAHRAPLDVSEAMVANVYEQFPTVIMTSATLTSRNSFDFFEQRLGLTLYKQRLAGTATEKGRARLVRTLALPTPFDFERQAIIVIPTDVETGFGKTIVAGTHALRDAILRLVRVTHGGAFLLFTSYGLLRKMADELRDELAAAGMPVFVQGTEHRDELLRRFRTSVHGVLFGTDSFWAGVDVAGEALRSVIITKLPFRVPTEPIVEARTEYIDRHEGNSFLKYTVPLAVIKFRQGFGRLIRTKSDYGMVAILDHRVLTKYYGKWFLESLPPCTRVAGPLEEILPQVEAFFAQHAPQRTTDSAQAHGSLKAVGATASRPLRKRTRGSERDA